MPSTARKDFWWPFLRALLLLLAFFASHSLQAQPIAVRDLAVLVDADGIETIASVNSSEATDRFTPLDGSLHAGHSRKVRWLRFSVQAPAAGPWWLEVMPPFLDDLRLFEPSGSGFAERRSGDRLPFASREENYRGFIFKLALADSAPHTFYLRLQTTSSSQLELQLWRPAQFQEAQRANYAVFGLYYGFLLLLLFLNLILWYWLRDPLHGWFSLAVLANLYLFLGANGLAAQYVLPGSEIVTDLWANSGFLVFIAAVAPFYQHILRIDREQKFYFAAFRVQVLLPCVLLLSLVTGHYTEAVRIVVPYSAFAALLVLYLSVRTWRHGQRESLLVLLGSVMNLMASGGSVLLLMGLSKGSVSEISSQQLMLLGSLMAMQMALVVRVRESNKVKRNDAQRAAQAEREAVHERELQFGRARGLAERNVMLERLHATENFSHATLDALSASVAILDEAGTIIAVNRAWRRIAQANGHGSDLLCEGANYFAVCDAASGAYSEGAHEMATGIRSVIQGLQEEFTLEYRCDSPTEERWFLSRVTRFDGETGACLVLAHRDISESVRANLARDEVQSLLTSIAMHVPGMVYQYYLRVDGSSCFPYASEAIREIYRVSPEQARENAAGVFAALHPDDHNKVVIAIQQSAADQTPWQQEFRVKFDDGTVRWLLGSALPQRHPDGGTLWHGFITDVTNRRKVEAELSEKAQLLATVLANSSVGIIFIRERKQVWSNARLCAMFGYTPAEFENQDPSLVYPSRQSEDKFVRIAYPALARDGYFSTPWEMRRKDGSLIWMSQSGTSVDRNDPGAGSIWVVEDISRQRQTEADLVFANDELTFQNEEKGKRAVELTAARDDAESANLAKSRFLATMSHEIRTPMNAVLGMAQVLMQSGISEANRLDYARTIFDSGQTLLALLNDILDLSKIEAGKVDLESIALAPAQLIGETLTLFAQTARAKGLSIEADWLGVEQRYLGDANRLRQMLSNLVGNAIKFTPRGSIRIEASEVASTGQSATLEFSVRDSGIGIAQDKQALLFQSFSQADSSTTRNYGGTGLGLSIVRTLARAMGGEAGVQSEAGVGSRFWFRVQVGLLEAIAPSFQSQAEFGASLGAAQPSQLSGRVLVIEDNPVNQKVIRVLLEQIGLETVLADDGQQALDALMGGEKAQLIMTDLQMPAMDGYAVAQNIRQWEAQTQCKRHPIVALSADAHSGVRPRCLAAGMDEVLSKPVLQGDLWLALSKWLPAASVAPQSAPIPDLRKPVDPVAIIALVNEILPMLAHGKADALDRFKALQELVAGSELAPEMAEAGLPLIKFRFDLTLERLRQMASKYEWKTAS